jgi:glycosyltransferase involved in cell wall biosynthesis
MPTVSVIIPAYNVADYLASSVQSVLDQTYADFEIIIVDDGSRDATAAVATAFKDPRVRLVRQANRGLAGARNTGIRLARGTYLAFLDADDLWHPDKLAAHVGLLESRPEVGVTFCQSAFIDDTGSPLNYLQRPKLDDIRPEDVLLRNPVGNGSSPVIRRATLNCIAFVAELHGRPEIFYFDESFRQSEDIECWTRIALQSAWKFAGIGQALTLYRVNSGGLSANLMKQLESWECFIAKTATYAPQFVARWASLARAFQYRYLARRAVRQGDPLTALRLLARAVSSAPAMLLREPIRTLVTLGAATIQVLLPIRVYRVLESGAMGLSTRTRGTGSAALRSQPGFRH